MPVEPIEDEKGDTPQLLIQYFNIFLRRKVWFLVPFILSTIVTVLLILYLPRTYLSTTLILVEGQRIPTEFVRSTVADSAEARLSTIRQQILSRSFLQKIINQFELYKDSQEDKGKILDKMEDSVRIETVGGGRSVESFSIGYIGRDPSTTMQVANRLAALFIEENLKNREQLVIGTTEFIDSQLEDLKKKLEEREAAVSRFKQAYSGELPGQLDANVRTVDRLQLELRSLKTSLSPLIQMQQDRKRQLIVLKKTHKDSHPDVQALAREINEFEKGETSIGAELAALQGREQQLLSQIKTYETWIQNTPQREQELTILFRDYQNIQRNYDALLDKRVSAQISENLEKKQKGEQFRILDPANFPERPYKPNPTKLGIGGLFLGLIVGIALAFGREVLDSSIRRPEDIERLISFPFLSSILDHSVVPASPSLVEKRDRLAPSRQQHSHSSSWTFSSSSNGATKKRADLQRNGHGGSSLPHADNGLPSLGSPTFSQKELSSGLVAFTEPHSVLAEQYRLLFMKIHHAAQGRKIKVISFTSSIEGEGKTTTISNLAITAARDFGRKSLLIDGDFKNPSVGKYFKIEQPFGVMDVIKKRCSLEKALTPGPVDNLTILPMGRSFGGQSNEMLSIGDLDAVLAEVRGHYQPLLWDDANGAFPFIEQTAETFDYIWIDAPPLIPVFDMTLIAESTEGIVFVVGAGEAPRHIINRAIKLLDTPKVIGAVLNRAKVPWMAKAYEYGYYSHAASGK